MSANTVSLLLACLAMMLLVALVGALLLKTRVTEMKRKRVHPQSVATARAMGERLENTAPADNFRNLFELPVMFYALVAVALAVRMVPTWLCVGAWAFVALRYAHSAIHCGYNQVMHRLYVFLAGFTLLVGLWIAFVVTAIGQGTV